MSVKQRKRRAAKRAHHAKQNYPLRACLFTGRIDDYIDGSNPTARRSLVFSEIGINSHRDAGKISSTDGLKLWGGWHPSHENIGLTPYDLIRREMFKNDVRHALNDLGIPWVVVALRDEVIRKVDAELARSDHDDFLYVDTLNGWRTWLPTQGEYILVNETLGLPIGKATTDEILEALKAKSPERHATTAETLLGELNKYGAKVERVKTLDHLGMMVDLTLRGKLSDITPDLFTRIRGLAGQSRFPNMPHLQPDVPNPGDLVLDMEGNVGEGLFKIIKGRDPELMGERFVIDSLSQHLDIPVPTALKDGIADKPEDTPYGDDFHTTPKGESDA